MNRLAIGCAIAALCIGAAQARNVELAVSDMDADDFACGLRYPAVKARAGRALAAAGVTEVDKAEHGVVVIVTTVKRPEYCASDLIVSLRRIVAAEAGAFRPRNGLATLELCRAGGLVAGAIENHERDFLAQVERSVGICLGQLRY